MNSIPLSYGDHQHNKESRRRYVCIFLGVYVITFAWFIVAQNGGIISGPSSVRVGPGMNSDTAAPNNKIASSPRLPTLETAREVYARHIPKRFSTMDPSGDLKAEWSNGWDFQFNQNGNCNSTQAAPEWRFCDPPPCSKQLDGNATMRIRYPLDMVLPKAEKPVRVVESIQKALRIAWTSAKHEPPVIDLYVRSGCGAAEKLFHLLQTVYLFWPIFLGKVLVVLDFNDREAASMMIPHELVQSHKVQVIFEHAPCMDGRLFNQYSYLNLFRYSRADYVVTIDSDCAFYIPVTPDLLFNDKGQLILPVSKEFQRAYNWDEMQEFFTRRSYHDLRGHPMITQPVNFHIASTFKPYLDWVSRTRGKCYEQLLIDLPKAKSDIYFHCWMCQLAVFVAQAPDVILPLYDLHDVDTRSDVFLRYAIHVSYEMAHGKDYRETVELAVNEGLCGWIGPSFLPADCSKIPTSNFLSQVRVHYAQTVVLRNVSFQAVLDRVSTSQRLFQSLLLSASTT